MDLRKTKVLPLDNPIEARRLFRELVHDEPFILFVVPGQGPNAEALVSKAGKFAGLENEPRWVVWARRLDDIASEILLLKEATPGMKDQVLGNGAAAFTTSFGDEIRDVIRNDEVADNVRVVQAYLRAEED
jgi:hypothetical protein